MTQAINMDCMEAMAQMPDKAFDLAIVDPPYGIGVNINMGRRKGDIASNYHSFAGKDKEPPSVEYFKELMRVSDNQIIWGANHFISRIPLDSPCWLSWDKGFSEDVTFATFELAWTSFSSTAKMFRMHPNAQNRIHPTQKPIKLYEWLLKNYAKDGWRIIDTHLGSGSSRIAADKMGFDFVGYELDTEYFEAQEKRFAQYKSQLTLGL